MLAACRPAILLTRFPKTYLGPYRISLFNNRFESQLQSVVLKPTFRSVSTMSLNSVVQSLATLPVKIAGTASHNAADSPTAWQSALNANSSSPKSFELLKTLVYKPKTAKSAVPIPVVVFLRDAVDANSAALGKKLGLKELRLASEDLLNEFFSLDKNSRMCYSSHSCISRTERQ